MLEQLELLIKAGNDPEVAVRKLQEIGVSQSLLNEVSAIRRKIIEERFSMSTRNSITEHDGTSSAWYAGPSDSDTFWPALREELLRDPGWALAVPSLDESSTDVVGLLADPHSPRIATRGLVLGHVQSGKTANFTATIAKAADAGYRLFVVLSGVHNALRRQTQIRLEAHLRELNPTKWLELTDEQRDFGNPVKALPLLAGTDLRLLAVVKKNVSRLTRLRDWLMQAHEHGGLETCPVLIIDDEADQASPNAARNADLDRTKVNERIVELLSLPRVAYVGYTATPFANVLINPTDARDLYPRTFIYSLPKPDIYFGAEELFGIGVTEDEETIGHDMIRTIPSSSDHPPQAGDEASMYRPTRKDEPFVPVVTASLDEAIRWFLLATAARRVRAGTAHHSSMLIHTTQRVDPQLAQVPKIRDHISGLREAWAEGDRQRWSDQWTEEQRREPPEKHGFEALAFDQLVDHLGEVLRQVKVVADNSRSTERLVYTDEPATVIAVGGNTLSRGLTLEGLVSSYFLRTASTYDSLLQMGRWFGYRVGYSDLPRIWTTKDLEEDFRFLSEVESDIRADIARYGAEDATPLDLPVRIRLHPRMQVAAKNKMQFAEHANSSFGGQRPQTTYFHHRDPDELRRNLDAARALLSRAGVAAAVETSASKIVLKGVPVEDVLEFVDAYGFHERSELRGRALTGYINRQLDHGALRDWNVAVMTRQPPAPQIDLGLGEVSLITRSKLTRTSDSTTANIGALMSRPDRVADLIEGSEAIEMSDSALGELRSVSGRPLLLLYPIAKDSEPKGENGRRSGLGALDHLVGVAFSFPGAVPGSEPDDLGKIAVDPSLLEFARSAEDDGVDYEDEEGSRDEVVLDDD